MRRRALGGVLAATTALLLVPTTGAAEETDTTCKNGDDPVHYSLTVVDGIVRAELRVLCIRD